MHTIYDFIHRQIFKRVKSGTLNDYLKSRIVDDQVSSIKDNQRILDQNISSLLTHVSAMIAASGILLIVFSEDRFIEIMIVIEMIGYSFATLALIMNLPYNSPHAKYNKQISDRKERIYNNYLVRRYMYVHTAYMVTLLTVLFIIMLILHLVLKFLW